MSERNGSQTPHGSSSRKAVRFLWVGNRTTSGALRLFVCSFHFFGFISGWSKNINFFLKVDLRGFKFLPTSVSESSVVVRWTCVKSPFVFLLSAGLNGPLRFGMRTVKINSETWTARPLNIKWVKTIVSDGDKIAFCCFFFYVAFFKSVGLGKLDFEIEFEKWNLRTSNKRERP